MWLSDKTSEALDIVVGGFFDLNRSFDRAVSIMQNTWAMPNAANIVHHNLAHIWPLMADVVSGFKDDCNVLTVYPETHGDNRTYESLNQMWSTLLEEVNGVYQMIRLAHSIATKEDDLNAMVMLQELIVPMNKLIGQVTTLFDKSLLTYDEFDFHISAWNINGVDLK